MDLEVCYEHIIQDPEFLERIVKDAFISKHTDGTIRIGVCYDCKKIVVDQYGDCPYGVVSCKYCNNTFCIEDCMSYCSCCYRESCYKCEAHDCCDE